MCIHSGPYLQCRACLRSKNLKSEIRLAGGRARQFCCNLEYQKHRKSHFFSISLLYAESRLIPYKFALYTTQDALTLVIIVKACDTTVYSLTWTWCQSLELPRFRKIYYKELVLPALRDLSPPPKSVCGGLFLRASLNWLKLFKSIWISLSS